MISIESPYNCFISLQYFGTPPVYEDVFLLNTPDNWRVFFEARHSMPTKALEKTKELDAVSIITDTIVPYKNFNKSVFYSIQ